MGDELARRLERQIVRVPVVHPEEEGLVLLLSVLDELQAAVRGLVRATLQGARAGYAGQRVIAVFQPHRYSRTKDQFHEFARSFYDADKVLICDVFGAGEEPIEGATSDALVTAIKAN